MKKKQTKQPKKSHPSKAVAIRKHTEAVAQKLLSLADPSQVMSFGLQLKEFIKNNSLSVKIGDHDYSMVDGWKYAGLNFGLTAVPNQPVKMHKDGEYITVLYSPKEFQGKNGKYTKEVAIFAGFTQDASVLDQVRLSNKVTREMTKPHFAYSCDCAIEKLSDKSKVSRGTGYCDNLELKKTDFDEYAVISMAETRSIGKAYRNLIGYVMKAAGFEPTPAEEMSMTTENYSETGSEGQKRPVPTNDEFKAIMKRVIQEGEEAIDKAKEHFSFTDDQLKSLQLSVPKK